MPVTLDWQHVALRLILTVAAGLIIGLNRGGHGRAAGIRTTLLVCLAASLSMIQANYLLSSNGRPQDSFVVMDIMRLPLGILSGMGFIGAGTILRREDLVIGVTTAATLWFTTVMGLCFGGGQLGLGIAALALGWGTLYGLKFVEKAMRQDVRATLSLSMSKSGPSDDELRASITQSGCIINSWGIAYTDHGAKREVCIEIQWRGLPGETRPPEFLSQLVQDARIENMRWQPQGIPRSFGLEDLILRSKPVDQPQI